MSVNKARVLIPHEFPVLTSAWANARARASSRMKAPLPTFTSMIIASTVLIVCALILLAQLALLLVGYMVPVVYLAEQLAVPVDYVIETMGAPDAVGGVAIAILVATPEAIGAVRAALANRVQRSINIFLGSVLSTICLTIPAMIAISYLTAHPLLLGVEHTDEWLLIVTLGVSIVTFASGHANVMQGCVHLILFAAYILLMFQG